MIKYQQGRFIDGPEYSNWSYTEKEIGHIRRKKLPINASNSLRRKMKIAESINMAAELVEGIESIKAIIKIAKDPIKEMGPDIADVLDGIGKYYVDSRAKAVKRFEHHGFSREEAILMTIDLHQGIKEALRNSKK